MAEEALEQTPTPSYRDVLQHPPVRVLSLSRFAAKMAVSTLSYGVMVNLAREGSSQFEISLANSAAYLAALIFGLQGGMIADSAAKRRVLYIAFLVQSTLCFIVPIFFGTQIGEMLVLIFMASALSQITGPGLKAAVALVATPEELATTGALVSLVGSIGSAIGSAFMAPILIKVWGIDSVLFVGGVLFALGAIRVRNLPDEGEAAKNLRESLQSVEWKPKALSLKYNAEWIVQNRAIASMILGGALVVALYEGFNTLLPAYVRDVLDADPANSIYIFAPAGIGFLIGALGGPWLIHRMGTRRLLSVSVGIMCVGMVLMGAIEAVAPIFAPFSPLRLLDWLFGIDVNDKVLAASVIAMPTNFGSTTAGQSVQVYINRHVSVERQGGMFGLEEVQQNALNLATVFSLGVVATFTGPQYVYIVAPLVVAGVLYLLVRYSYRTVARESLSISEGLDYVRQEPETVGEDLPD